MSQINFIPLQPNTNLAGTTQLFTKEKYRFLYKIQGVIHPWYLSILTKHSLHFFVCLIQLVDHIILSALDSWWAVLNRSLICHTLLIPYTSSCATSPSLVVEYWILIYFLNQKDVFPGIRHGTCQSSSSCCNSSHFSE